MIPEPISKSRTAGGCDRTTECQFHASHVRSNSYFLWLSIRCVSKHFRSSLCLAHADFPPIFLSTCLMSVSCITSPDRAAGCITLLFVSPVDWLPCNGDSLSGSLTAALVCCVTSLDREAPVELCLRSRCAPPYRSANAATLPCGVVSVASFQCFRYFSTP